MSIPPAAESDTEYPVTLHRVMQTVVAQGLHKHYKVQRDLPHDLFVLLMQMNQNTPVAKPIRQSPLKSRQTIVPLAKRAGKLPSVEPTA